MIGDLEKIEIDVLVFRWDKIEYCSTDQLRLKGLMYGVEKRFKMQLLLGLKGSPLRHGNPATKDYLTATR